MNTRQAEETLLRSIKARCPIIGVETGETRRFLESLVSIIDEEDERNKRQAKATERRELFTFSVTGGLRQMATYSGEFRIPSDPNDLSKSAPAALVYQEKELMPPGADPERTCYEVTQVILENDVPTEDQRFGPRRVYVMKDVHAFFSDPMFVRGLRDLAEVLINRHQTIILVSPDLSQLPPVLRNDVKVMSWPLPGPDELANQIDAFCANLDPDTVDLNGQQEMLVEALRGLTAVQADQVLADATIEHGVLDERAVKSVIAAKAEIIKGSGALEFYPPETSLSDVGGMDNLKSWLAEAGQSNTPEARAFGVQRVRGALVLGVPGCGKSLTAKALSQMWGVPLLQLNVGALFGQYVGQSESQARQALRLASAISPCILWIDEIEKGLSSQGGELDGGTSMRVLGTILTWMEEKASGVFIFATANDISGLRPELVRRFTELFFVDLPSPSERRTIFRIHIRKSGRNPDDYNLDSVVDFSEQFTGQEIEETVQGALRKAFQAGADLSETFLEQTAQETVPLVTTMRSQIDAMRRWATRARPASSNQQAARGRVVAEGAGTRSGAVEM